MLHFFGKKEAKERDSSQSPEHRAAEGKNTPEKTLSHPYVQLANEAITQYIISGEVKETLNPLPEDLKKQAGVFVSIKKKGKLRGCIGTFQPKQPNLAREIIHNAISSATQDPRFPAITKEELPDLAISVDILSTPESVKELKDLDPKRFGVIVSKGWRRALLLPDLEGVDTVEEQLQIVRHKAGIAPYEDIEIMRFEVKRYQ